MSHFRCRTWLYCNYTVALANLVFPNFFASKKFLNYSYFKIIYNYSKNYICYLLKFKILKGKDNEICKEEN